MTAPLSISALNRLVRNQLEASFALTWVRGEISNLTYAASGHVYFSLKDNAAQVRCVMWRSKAQTLGFRLENGQQIDARALISLYEPRGDFQLTVESLRRSGQGDLLEAFLRLKTRLEQEGLFAPEQKKILPRFPATLAIVTSPQAAALRDVLSTLRRRAPHIRICLYPTPVQGEGAEEKIAQAIQTTQGGPAEAIILCRGGGSIEDLWAFNAEIVARSIRDSRLPVVAGIGHETDFTIADFAADARAPTPTAAAELLSPVRDQLLDHLQRQQFRLLRQVDRDIAQHRQRLDHLARRLIHPAERLARQRSVLQQQGQRLQRALRQHLHNTSTKLFRLQTSLRQLDPHAVLQRGYALALGPDGKPVKDANALQAEDRLTLRFAHGGAEVRVTHIAP